MLPKSFRFAFSNLVARGDPVKKRDVAGQINTTIAGRTKNYLKRGEGQFIRSEERHGKGKIGKSFSTKGKVFKKVSRDLTEEILQKQKKGEDEIKKEGVKREGDGSPGSPRRFAKNKLRD